MRNLLIAACLALAACTPATVSAPDPGIPSAAERCDSSGTVDSRAVCVAFEAFDAALYAIDALVAAGVLVPGTPKALAVQAAIRDAQALLNNASAIQRGVRSGDLASTLTNAAAAVRRMKAALAN